MPIRNCDYQPDVVELLENLILRFINTPLGVPIFRIIRPVVRLDILGYESIPLTYCGAVSMPLVLQPRCMVILRYTDLPLQGDTIGIGHGSRLSLGTSGKAPVEA